MINRYYSVYDRKALVYLPPFPAVNDATAIRTLTDAVASGDNSVGRHPEDYVLYCVGEFDDNSGVFGVITPAVHVIDAQACVRVGTSTPFNPDLKLVKEAD